MRDRSSPFTAESETSFAPDTQMCSRRGCNDHEKAALANICDFIAGDWSTWGPLQRTGGGKRVPISVLSASRTVSASGVLERLKLCNARVASSKPLDGLLDVGHGRFMTTASPTPGSPMAMPILESVSPSCRNFLVERIDRVGWGGH